MKELDEEKEKALLDLNSLTVLLTEEQPDPFEDIEKDIVVDETLSVDHDEWLGD